VVIASGQDAHLVDSLAAAPLAFALGAPILLADDQGLTSATSSEVGRLHPGRAIVVGGVAAVSEQAVRALEALGVPTERIAGDDRYQTAGRVAMAMGGQRPDVVVASGEDAHLVDALAAAGGAAAAGRPILLTARSSVPGATEVALAVVGAARTVVAGGTSAVPDNLLARLPSPVRVAGNGRYGTSRALADYFTPIVAASPGGFRRAAVASGESAHIVDALAAGALGAITVLTPGPDPRALEWIAAQRLAFGRLVIVGGAGAVDPAVEAAVRAAVVTW
jgi:putative cell wall-binding protein